MKIIIVSNRLPFTVRFDGTRLTFERSLGGVASGLDAYAEVLKQQYPQMKLAWIGWPGIDISTTIQTRIRQQMKKEYHAIPVFLSKEDEKKFYYGFCNKTIWPLFHNFSSYCDFREDYWVSYKKVNKMFAQEIINIYEPGDIIFVNDYQLLLVPKYVREQLPDACIGFFLHIPFPHHEIFQFLRRDVRKEIAEGLLGADLVGFHTQDFVQNFLHIVRRLLGKEHLMGEVQHQVYKTKVVMLPLGISVKKFLHAIQNKQIALLRSKIEKQLSSYKIILSVDRLDYTKGIAKRLLAYEVFLQKNPLWHNKVVLELIAAPSRTEIGDYQKMKQEVDELIGRINGKYGGIAWTPIMYQYRSVSFEEIVALYGVSSVAIVTPLQDGMNLVAKEFIASRIDKTGVLILSETAGAAKELTEALLVNPNSKEEIAHAMKKALEMPRDEQMKRNSFMQQQISTYDITYWATKFHMLLEEAYKKRKTTHSVSRAKKKITADYHHATQRLLLFDYDGTLVPFKKLPELAKPTGAVVHALQKLARDPRTDVVILSGRDKETLNKWLGKIPIGLSAEHGAYTKEKNSVWKVMTHISWDWKAYIRPLLQQYTDRVDKTFIEEKEYSFAWHYRNAPDDIAGRLSRELSDDLISFTANTNLHTIVGNKVIEVREATISKSSAARHFIARKNYDFIFAIGDDKTDEDMFTAIPKAGYSIKVGKGITRAMYTIDTQKEVLPLIKTLFE